MSLHAVRKINETISLKYIYFFFCQHCLKAKYMQMSTLAAGACTRGISTVCWQPAFPCPHRECTKRTQRFFFLHVLSQSEKTFPPSVALRNGKLFRLSCRSVLFPHGLDRCTGGAGFLPQKKQMVAHQKVASGSALDGRAELKVISDGGLLLVWF